MCVHWRVKLGQIHILNVSIEVGYESHGRAAEPSRAEKAEPAIVFS